MANTDYTVTALLASIKRRGMLPNTEEALDDSDYFAFADEEMQTYIVPEMMSVSEEYFVTYKDHTVQNGQSSYFIPYRASGVKLRNVLYCSNTPTNLFVPLPRIEPENANLYGYGVGGPIGYELRNNSVVLVPAPGTSGGILRLEYFIRPNTLVDVSAVGTITAINSATQVTCNNVPTTFTTSQTYDLIKYKPGFDTYVMDQTITARSTGTNGTVTFTDDLPDDLEVGDYVCLSTQSPVAQIPYELHALLAQRVAFKAQEALGDPRAQVAEKVCDAMAKRIFNLLTPRSEGSSRYLVNRYGPGNIGLRYRLWRT